MAKKAGVSVATISRAINPETREMVAPDTLSNIDDLVQRHHYVPNLAAKHLRSVRCKTVGILLPHIPNIFLSEYYSKILAGVSNSLIDSDFRFKLVALKPYTNKWDGYSFQSAEGVDGLIVTYWPTFFSSKFAVDVPCVVVSDPDERIRAHFVACDNIRGGELAAEHLYRHGHERIAILTGQDWSTDSHLRVKGFKALMKRMGTAVPNEMIFRANYEEDQAAKIVEQLMLEKRKITAFFCCNDGMAVGVLQKLKQLGISCPKRISVIGFDDEGRAWHTDPPLTTVRSPIYDLGRVAGDILVRFLKEGSKSDDFFHKQTVLPVSLIERKSVAAAR